MRVVTSFVNPPVPVRRFEAEAVQDLTGSPDLLSAARCALNVLTLLEKEVAALGCNAKNVTANLRAAIERRAT